MSESVTSNILDDNEDMRISIKGAYAEVSYKSGNRSKATKSMPVSKLIEVMSSSTKVVKEFSFYPAGLRFVGNNGGKTLVAYELPERAGIMRFRGYSPSTSDNTVEQFNSVYPWGITFIELTNSPDGMFIDKFYQFALKGPITSMTDMMYTWPGSNVYPDHHCCMGGINVGVMKTIFETGDLPFLFYNGVSNHDLENNKFVTAPGMRGSRPYDLYKGIEVVEGSPQKPFPYNILKNAMSIKSFLETRGYKNA